jgi:hypothetical protein
MAPAEPVEPVAAMLKNEIQHVLARRGAEDRFHFRVLKCALLFKMGEFVFDDFIHGAITHIIAP